MEPEQPNNPPLPEQTPEAVPQAEEQHSIAHTYQDDLAHAMNATEAPVVQAMLQDARDREAFAVQEQEERKRAQVVQSQQFTTHHFDSSSCYLWFVLLQPPHRKSSADTIGGSFFQF